jgi:hypothetical protein
VLGVPWPCAVFLLLCFSFTLLPDTPQGFLSAHPFCWLPLSPWVNKPLYVLVPVLEGDPCFLSPLAEISRKGNWFEFGSYIKGGTPWLEKDLVLA